jgi:hypothetical protein
VSRSGGKDGDSDDGLDNGGGSSGGGDDVDVRGEETLALRILEQRRQGAL